MEAKVLIIGLDGGSWNVLMPMVKRGLLKVLRKLVREGSWGVLESTIPPVTGAAWLSMATGRSPGKTGVIDFFKRREDTLKLELVTSRDFKGISIWDYLNYEGFRVGIVDYPMLYPPYEVKGFMVSMGLGAPLDARFEDLVYPNDFANDLERMCRGRPLSVNYHDIKYNNYDLFWEDLDAYMNYYEERVYKLLHVDCDLFFIVFPASDWVQHIMWRHIDINHPLFDYRVSPAQRKRFEEFWCRVDRMIGEMLDIVGEQCLVFLVSDHGFGPNDQTFNLAKWLEVKGYAKRRGGVILTLKDILYEVARRHSDILRLFVPGFLTSKASSMLSIDVGDWFDLSRSDAVCLGHTIPFGAVYIVSNDERRRNEVKRRLVNDLKHLGEDIGKNVNVKIYDAKAMYSGNKTNSLPDVIFTINDWRCVIVENSFARPLFEDKPFSPRHTGSHRLEGIIVAHGPGIRKGFNLGKVKIYDIMPTVLHLFGLPIPNDVDGRILSEIFEPSSEYASRAPKYVEEGYYRTKAAASRLRNSLKRRRSCEN